MVSLTKVMSIAHLYDDHANNPLGTTEEEIAEASRIIYTAWRTSDKMPTVEILEEEILSDFVLPIGAVGMFVTEEGTSHMPIEAAPWLQSICLYYWSCQP
jgi:hypothetical protein